MARFSINTVGLFPGKNLFEAAQECRKYGFDHYERWTLAPGEEEMVLQAEKEGVYLYACCPDCFVLNDLSVHDEYIRQLRRVIRRLEKSSCRTLITQVGQDTGEERERQHDAIAVGLRRAVPILEDSGFTLLVEPLNDVKDHPGYYLTSSQEGAELIRETESGRVKLLYDVYHQLHMGEDPEREADRLKKEIGHYHIAGFPNRDERLFEGYDHESLLRKMSKSDVRVGVELFPSSPEAVPGLMKKLHAFCQ